MPLGDYKISDFSYKSYAGHPRFYSFRALGSLQFSLEHVLAPSSCLKWCGELIEFQINVNENIPWLFYYWFSHDVAKIQSKKLSILKYYIWKGLYMEGLFFRILPYLFQRISIYWSLVSAKTSDFYSLFHLIFLFQTTVNHLYP